MPPLPPILVPGLGLMPVPKALDLLAPPLSPEEGIYLNSLTELTAALTGLDQSDLDNPPPSRVVQLLSSPTDQLRELSGALAAVASGGGSTPSGTSGTSDEDKTKRVANREVWSTSIYGGTGTPHVHLVTGLCQVHSGYSTVTAKSYYHTISKLLPIIQQPSAT